MYLTQKITHKVNQYVSNDELALELILNFNDKNNHLLEEYTNNPSADLEEQIVHEFESFILDELYNWEVA